MVASWSTIRGERPHSFTKLFLVKQTKVLQISVLVVSLRLEFVYAEPVVFITVLPPFAAPFILSILSDYPLRPLLLLLSHIRTFNFYYGYS